MTLNNCKMLPSNATTLPVLFMYAMRSTPAFSMFSQFARVFLLPHFPVGPIDVRRAICSCVFVLSMLVYSFLPRICFLVFFRYNNAFLWVATLCWKLSENYKHACRHYQSSNIQKQRPPLLLMP